MLETAHLPRIIAAIVYDTIVVLCLVFLAAQWFPLIPDSWNQHWPIKTLKQIYVLGIIFLYFSTSWRRGGQTIGMKSWRIKLLQNQAKDPTYRLAISWRQCLIRYLVAILSWLAVGLGFIWVLFNSKRLSWHDMASHTRIILLPQSRPTK